MKHPITLTAPAGLLAGAIAMHIVMAPVIADWEFENETATRFQVAPSLGANDQEEKDYAWGDANNNGWVDLVIMRKQPFSTPGKRVNVLMMNENGVLVDRTAEFASASDVTGDSGFLTPTNDRHSILADLTHNGWLDLTTAPAYGSGDPKHVSHPRVYRNQGESGGAWQGFRFENNRIPQFPSPPNNCAVAAGDVNNNGFTDLYFITYSDSQNDRLVLNNGSGFFTDQTSMLPSGFTSASFGTAGAIADLTGNGWGDIIKSENGPVKAVYNFGSGNFSANVQVSGGAHYHMHLADLNNNGRLDLIIVDDGQDRVKLNLSTNTQGHVNWGPNIMLPESSCGSGNVCTGFGGNVYAVDLNNSGWMDIVVADVDVDISGCGRHSNIYRNNMNGPNVTFTRDIGNIPVSMLQGVFDFGLLDITGNGWTDIVVGRCSGTQVWIQQAPFSLAFDYPSGRPDHIEPNDVTPLDVELFPVGGTIDSGSVRLHTAVNGGGFAEQVMTNMGGNVYRGELPAVSCLDEVAYFITASISGTEFNDPINAPAHHFLTVAVYGFEVTREEDFDAPVPPADWSVNNDPLLAQGQWQHGNPEGALHGLVLGAPFGDSSPSGTGKAFATCLGTAGNVADCQVSGGPTSLVSEVIDLAGTSATISYDRWFYSSMQNDPQRATFLETYVSNDNGNTWVFVHKTGGTNSEWETASFMVSDHVTPTAHVRVRFFVEDHNSVQTASITNAGIDNIVVEEVICLGVPVSCDGDLTDSTGSGPDGVVNGFDLLKLLGCWGTLPNPLDPDCDGADIATATGAGQDDVVNGFDLLALLGNWGLCP